MRKILVGIDGSPESRTAAERAADLAAATSAQLVLAYVVSLPVQLAPEPSYLERLGSAEREQARTLLDEVASAFRERGLAVDTVMPSGSPAETLANMASQPDVDLVVVGHRGRGAISRVLLGSVADRLMQTSPKPVLLSR
jgi:nucleotide-binding universal stress UspA family protein